MRTSIDLHGLFDLFDVGDQVQRSRVGTVGVCRGRILQLVQGNYGNGLIILLGCTVLLYGSDRHEIVANFIAGISHGLSSAANGLLQDGVLRVGQKLQSLGHERRW